MPDSGGSRAAENNLPSTSGKPLERFKDALVDGCFRKGETRVSQGPGISVVAALAERGADAAAMPQD